MMLMNIQLRLQRPLSEEAGNLEPRGRGAGVRVAFASPFSPWHMRQLFEVGRLACSSRCAGPTSRSPARSPTQDPAHDRTNRTVTVIGVRAPPWPWSSPVSRRGRGPPPTSSSVRNFSAGRHGGSGPAFFGGPVKHRAFSPGSGSAAPAKLVGMGSRPCTKHAVAAHAHRGRRRSFPRVRRPVCELFRI